jgi:hypothetical protein
LRTLVLAAARTFDLALQPQSLFAGYRGSHFGRPSPFSLPGNDLTIGKQVTPQTPAGSRRSSAPCKQGTTKLQVLQMALANSMSGISSEKKSGVSEPAPSRHAASTHVSVVGRSVWPSFSSQL